MKNKINSLIAGLIFFAASNVLAGYTIQRVDLGANDLVQGRDYQYIITSSPVVSDPIFITVAGINQSHDIQAGTAQIGPNKYKMIGGQLQFFIKFHSAPGTIQFNVTNANDPGQVQTIPITIRKHPTQFTITPNPPAITAGVSFSVTVQVKDQDGVLVGPFQDDVQITNLPSGASTIIPGSSFSGGMASINHTVNIGDFDNLAQLNVRIVGMVYYTPNAQPVANNTFGPLQITPGAFQRLAMLFPGEQLNPGGPKSGNVATQVAGSPVPLVQLWPLDNWYNPIRSSVNIPVSFTSNVGSDAMPGPITVINPPYPLNGGSVDEFLFLTNGTRNINAVAAGQTSTSVVPVLPGQNTNFEFSIQPAGTYTTDNNILVQITAKEASSGFVLTQLHGRLPGALLTARYTQLNPIEEEAIWVDTNPNTIFPENIVNFNSGVATMFLNVTRRGSNIELCFEDQYNNRKCSNQFNMDPGALSKIHMTIVGRQGIVNGEQFTAGTYPGNSGQAPAMTAGEDLMVEARLTDAHWNVITSPNPTFTKPIQINSIIPTTYITATPTNKNFDSTGELLFNSNSNFDQSFRVKVRTAGGGRRFSATSDFGPVGGFLSSTITVNSAAYSKLVISAPGETLRPGSFFTNGKEGSPPAIQPSGQLFGPVTVYATDNYFNPIRSGPYPTVKLNFNPDLPGSFINGYNLNTPISLGNNSKPFQIQLAETTNITVTEGAKSGSVQIQAGSGALDHFKMTMNTPSPYVAGQLINVTIEALDEFNVLRLTDNGVVNLAANSGAGTMSPTSVNLSGGMFTGDIQFFTAGTSRFAKMSRASVSTNGPSINVDVAASGFQKLLLLGPGESHKPGTLTGKSGSNAPSVVGVGVTLTAIACDTYYNKLNIAGNTVNFTSNKYATFSPASGIISSGDFSTTLVLNAATLHTLKVEEQTLSYSANTTMTGTAGAYNRLLVLAPGEIADPGNVAQNGKNPASPALNQKVSVPFALTIQAVDQFFNRVTTYNGGDTLITIDTLNSSLNPSNNVLNGPTPRKFVNGELTRNVLIIDQGLRKISVIDQKDKTKTEQLIEVQLDPGPIYVFNNAASGNVGSDFVLTVSLEENGVPLIGYNESIYLDAYFPAGGPASGSFNPDGTPKEYIMNNGQVNITDLKYAHVEDIQIRLTDNFSRVAFSNTIAFNPSGLRYKVTVPATGIVGPPQTFPITVELRDQTTDTLVKNPAYNHTIGIDIISLLNPPAAGALSISQAPLNQGISMLNVSYSKAEQIQIQISDKNNAVGAVNGFSNSLLLSADGYKKLLILAPGEVHQPGLYQHATGKTGTPSAIDKTLPQTFQVRGVDQHWNVDSSFNGGSIFYLSDDGSTGLNNPVNQNSPLVNGETAASIYFNTSGNVKLTATDINNPAIIPQTVIVPVSGTYFDIQAPAQTNSGAPFTMIITLKDTTGNTVAANGPITLEALKTDGSPVAGILDVTSANLSQGVGTITNQSYTIAEDIRIRISGHDTVTLGQTISFVPRAIFYIFETMPAKMEVNVPSSIVIRAYDQDTGTKVVNFNRSNLPLVAYSVINGQLATGNWVPSTINIVNGVGSISPVYDRAESIFLKLNDNTTVFDPPPVPTQSEYNSPSTILVTPGPLSSVDNLADFSLQSNETITITYLVRDTFNNPIPNQTIGIRVNEPGVSGSIQMNGQTNSFVAKTNSNGEISVTFQPSQDAHGEFQMLFEDTERENGYSQIFNINVLGLLTPPSQASPLGGNRIPVNSSWKITEVANMSAQVNESGGTISSFYRIDGGEWFSYDPAVGILANDPGRGYPVFNEAKTYQVEWYSEVCYTTPCTKPINELILNGGVPKSASVSCINVDGKLAGFPSPFNPKRNQFLTLQYPLGGDGPVTIDIYTLFGEKIRTIEVQAGAEGGQHKQNNQILWDGTNDNGHLVANGGYIVRVTHAGGTMKTKVLMVK